MAITSSKSQAGPTDHLLHREDLSADEARRIALAAQGFDRPRPRGAPDARHLRRTLQTLGLLQVDYVNVLVPAHYQVPFSRLGGYRRELLNELVYSRREFTEQWAHEASIVPVSSWPLLRYRRENHRVRPWGFEKFLQRHSKYADWVLEEIRSRGPLTADDLPEPEGRPRRISDKWGWGLALRKQVLEAHFGFGRLAVAGRERNFQRRYDLPERVVAKEHLRRHVENLQAQRDLLAQAARAHGCGTASDLADYYRMPVRDARPRIAELVEEGDLREVRVEGWNKPAYLHARARLPRSVHTAALLSPFDPVVWFRPRVARLFGFEYRIEIFVPREKRTWGYYVLPFLLGDRLVARVDLKADRKAARLCVMTAYAEPTAKPAPVARALAAELHTMAAWLDLSSVHVGRRGGLARQLKLEVRSYAPT